MKFKYLKGSEKDFEGAEDCHLYLLKWAGGGKQFATRNAYRVYFFHGAMFDLIAQREPITKSLRESFYCPQGVAGKLGHGLDCEECIPVIKYSAIIDWPEIIANESKQAPANPEPATKRTKISEVMDRIIKQAADRAIDKSMSMAVGSPIPPAAPVEERHASEEECVAIRIQNNRSRPLRAEVTEKGGVVNIETTITERGTQYGDFNTGGTIMQELKSVMRNTPNWQAIRPQQREALEMIQHKIGRILNGNSDYDDNWRDIAGYATLILNSLSE